MRRDLDEGGVGMGMGITYTPTATPEEILTLFHLAAAFKRPVFVHMRGGGVVAALQEVITNAMVSGAPLHIVHINSAATARTPLALQMIDAARARGVDVTTEAYPYTASMTEIASAAYSNWAGSGTRVLLAPVVARDRRAADPRIVREVPQAGRLRHLVRQHRRRWSAPRSRIRS